jgi:hypothetical protein
MVGAAFSAAGLITACVGMGVNAAFGCGPGDTGKQSTKVEWKNLHAVKVLNNDPKAYN